MQEDSQRQAQLAQYNDELARKRQQAEHELQRQRNTELVGLQEQAAARKEAERLRIEQQIQAERRAADQHAVRSWCICVWLSAVGGGCCGGTAGGNSMWANHNLQCREPYGLESRGDRLAAWALLGPHKLAADECSSVMAADVCDFRCFFAAG